MATVLAARAASLCFMLGLLAGMALLVARLDLGARFSEFAKTLSRRASSSGIDMPSGLSAASAGGSRRPGSD